MALPDSLKAAPLTTHTRFDKLPRSTTATWSDSLVMLGSSDIRIVVFRLLQGPAFVSCCPLVLVRWSKINLGFSFQLLNPFGYICAIENTFVCEKFVNRFRQEHIVNRKLFNRGRHFS